MNNNRSFESFSSISRFSEISNPNRLRTEGTINNFADNAGNVYLPFELSDQQTYNELRIKDLTSADTVEYDGKIYFRYSVNQEVVSLYRIINADIVQEDLTNIRLAINLIVDAYKTIINNNIKVDLSNPEWAINQSKKKAELLPPFSQKNISQKNNNGLFQEFKSKILSEYNKSIDDQKLTRLSDLLNNSY